MTENSPQSYIASPNLNSIESKQSISPAFSFNLFKRKVIDASLPTDQQRVLIECNVPNCTQKYNQKYPGNTTTLLEHFKSKHKDVLFKMARDAIKSGKPKEETILGTKLLKGLTSIPKEITEYFRVDKIKSKTKSGKKRKVPFSGNCSPEKYQNVFAHFIVRGNVPFLACDHSFTKKLVDDVGAGSSELVSSSQTMLQVKKMYFQQVDKLRKEFEKHDGRFSLNFDICKAENGDEYLGIKVHFFNKSFKLKHYNIGLELIAAEDRNGESLAESLTRVLKYYKIDDRIFSITRDSDPVIDEMVTLFKGSYRGQSVGEKIEWDVCSFGYACNLSVKALMTYAFPKIKRSDAMEERIYSILPKDIQTLPKKVRKILEAIRENDMVRRLLDIAINEREYTDTSEREILEEENFSGWISEFEMIHCLLYFKEQITEVSDEIGLLPLAESSRGGFFEITDFEWNYLEALRDVLLIFVQPMKGLQRFDYDTIYATIPSIYSILDRSKEMTTQAFSFLYPTISHGLTVACDKIYEYYPIYNEDCGDMLILYTATALHPEYKLEFFSTRDSFPMKLVERIEQEMVNSFHHYENQYGKQRSKRGENPEKEIAMDIDTFEDEGNDMEEYLLRRIQEGNVDEFYRSTKNTFPVLHHFAKEIMAIPAMSTPKDHYFSMIGDIIPQSSTKSYPAMMKMLAVVKEMVMRIKPGHPAPDLEASDEKPEDDVELSTQALREIDYYSDGELDDVFDNWNGFERFRNSFG